KQPTKFEAYYDFQERAATIPSHRYLAIRRGEAEGVLRVAIDVDKPSLQARVAKVSGVKPSSPFREQYELAIKDGIDRLLCPSIENDMRVDLK
ncbi:hypothetical protein ABTH42_18935, partial [Acinetobacter baumannii]